MAVVQSSGSSPDVNDWLNKAANNGANSTLHSLRILFLSQLRVYTLGCVSVCLAAVWATLSNDSIVA